MREDVWKCVLPQPLTSSSSFWGLRPWLIWHGVPLVIHLGRKNIGSSNHKNGVLTLWSKNGSSSRMLCHEICNCLVILGNAIALLRGNLSRSIKTGRCLWKVSEKHTFTYHTFHLDAHQKNYVRRNILFGGTRTMTCWVPDAQKQHSTSRDAVDIGFTLGNKGLFPFKTYSSNNTFWITPTYRNHNSLAA